MKIKLLFIAAFGSALGTSCGSPQALNSSVPKAGTAVSSAPSPSTSPVPTPVVPADGDYDGKGVVTKIDLDLGSVGIDHEEIKGVMPPMSMEFYVSDKKILDGVSVGDKIEFVLRHRTPTETIVKIKKAK